MRASFLLLILGVVACGDANAPPQHPHRDGDFDRGGAAGAMNGVDVKACGSAAGPSGHGHVKVTFAADGSVIDTKLDKGPSDASTAFIGTPRGDCILDKFRAVHVPAFNGGPITVGKAFTLE